MNDLPMLRTSDSPQRGAMMVATAETIAGYRVRTTLGVVRGNAVRVRHVGVDLIAAFRNLVGGEIPEYTAMLAQTREQALDRMCEEALRRGANAVIGLRLTTASVMQSAAEILAYGTAVVIEPE